MVKEIYFIRHGKPDYSHINKEDNIAMAMLAPLSGEGHMQARNLRNELNLFDKFVFTSPYPRALETACIFANGNPMAIEPDLHEWLPSKSFNKKAKAFEDINREYLYNNGEKSSRDDIYDYETKQEMKDRVQRIIDKNIKIMDKMVFVCHARLISAFLDCPEPDYCQIIKYEYEYND